MARIPPSVTRIQDRNAADGIVRLLELIDALDTRVTACEARLVTAEETTTIVPALQTEVRKVAALVRRVFP